MNRLLCLLIGYVFGLFQTGLIYSKICGTDIRKHGSGNSGATNSLRVLGKKAGIIVLLGDVFKCVAACTLCRMIFGNDQNNMTLIYVLYAGLGTVLGHDYPFFLKFKGGKGISCTGGVVISLFDIRIFLISLAVLIIIVYITRYVSMGSMLGSLTFFISWTVITLNRWNNIADSCRFESCVIVFIIAFLAIIRHKTNIKRLFSGTENKLGNKK